jgi:hypothetical protein
MTLDWANHIDPAQQIPPCAQAALLGKGATAPCPPFLFDHAGGDAALCSPYQFLRTGVAPFYPPLEAREIGADEKSSAADKLMERLAKTKPVPRTKPAK